MKFFLIVMSLVMFLFSGNVYAEDQSQTVAPKPKVFKSFKSLPNGVVVRKTIFQGDPRFRVSPDHELTFRTYVYNNKVIAVSWQNAPRQLDPFALSEVSLQGMISEMKYYLANQTKYRVVTIFDTDRTAGSSGVIYVPSVFPEGFSIKDLKW